MKYASDAINDLIPEITLILNKYDASLEMNSDLNQSGIELAKENTLLINHHKNENNKKWQVLKDSLQCKEKSDEIKN